MEFAEKVLEEQTVRSANPLVMQLVDQLDSAIVPKSNNVGTNRKLWDTYCREWTTSTDWVQKMAGQVGMQSDLQTLGDEWSSRREKDEIIREFILPYVSELSRVAEIGVGGGRIAREVVGKVYEFHCYDVSERMLQLTRSTVDALRDYSVAPLSPVQYHLVNESCSLGESAAWNGYFDFIYAFDVFPHVSLHVIYRYLQEIKRTLNPIGGKAFLSTADITSPGGFERFSVQRMETVGGFCFTSPDCIVFLAEQAGLRVIKTGDRRSDNVYLNRDFLIVVERIDDVDC